MFKKYLFPSLLLSSFFLLMACSKTEKPSVNFSKVNYVTSADDPMPSCNSLTYSMDEKLILENNINLNFTYSADSVPFSERIKNLLSASFDSSDTSLLGTISSDYYDNTGAWVSLKLKFDDKKQLKGDLSNMQIKIVDSLVGTKNGDGNTILPLFFNLANGSGAIDLKNKTMNLVFEDSYGKIKVSGRFDNYDSYLLFDYENIKSFDGSDPKSGRLGALKISNCAIL